VSLSFLLLNSATYINNLLLILALLVYKRLSKEINYYITFFLMSYFIALDLVYKINYVIIILLMLYFLAYAYKINYLITCYKKSLTLLIL